jgi:hypothetical protein
MGYTILGMHAGHQGMDKMIRAMLILLCLVVNISEGPAPVSWVTGNMLVEL